MSGISHQLTKKGFFSLELDSDFKDDVPSFELTLGNGWHRLGNGYFTIGINGLNIVDLIDIKDKLNKIIQTYGEHYPNEDKIKEQFTDQN